MKIERAVCFSLSLESKESMAYLRLISPLNQLGVEIIDGIKSNQSVEELVKLSDIVIIQREFTMNFGIYQELVKIAQKENKPIIYDLDDLLFFLPENHPDKLNQYFAPFLLQMFHTLMDVSLITVPTRKLKDVLLNFNENVVILPNFFNDNLWKLRTPLNKSSSNGSLTIGYMGTNSHKPDLDYIAPSLLNIIRRYPMKVSLNFWGIQPPFELVSLPQVKWFPQKFDSYEKFAEYFQNQSADILISPLVDNLFNRCKSPIKFFEYSALGAPGIYSKLDPYMDIITDGYDGLLATSVDDWTQCLTRLILDDELRYNIAMNAQKTIKENWFLSQKTNFINNTYQKAFENGSQKSDTNRENLIIMKSSFKQFIETNNHIQSENQSLKKQIVDKDNIIHSQSLHLEDSDETIQLLKNNIEEVESEVVKLALSTSWRITRPLRKLMKLIREIGKNK